MIFHLMIVDDETTIRKGLTQVVNWEAIDCIIQDTASDGLEAIEKLKENPADIIITDIRMPESDGLDLAKYVMEHYPEIKVIILTGYADFEYAKTAIKYNVSDFLLKPISIEQVVASVQSAQKKIIASRQKNTAKKSDVAFMIDQLLQELTDASYSDTLAARLKEYNISLESYYVAAFQFIPYAGNISALKEIIIKLKSNSYCYRYNNLIIAIYFYPACTGRCPAVPRELLQNCRDITAMADSFYEQKLTIGISSHHTSPGEYSVAVFESIRALTLNFYSQDNIAFYQEQGTAEDYTLSAGETLSVYELENAIISLDFDAAEQILNSIFIKLQSNFAKSSDVKNLCIHIYYTGTHILLEKGLEMPDNNLLHSIENSSNIFELESIVKSLLQILRETLLASEISYSKTVKDSIAYITENLKEPITLEQLAGHVHVNPSYLSRTFKKETGHTITDFINLKRIERAKELLSDRSILTYEIAEQVGFNDPAYFSAIFKKYVGMTPKEFRG